MGRKVRSDKKRDIKPTVSKELKDCVYRLSFITDAPVKDVIEEILKSGSQRQKVISHLSQYFLRDVRINNTVYIGDHERMPIRKRSSIGRNQRISTRVTSNMYEVLSALAYAMDCSVSRACALIIEATIKDTDFVNDFAKEYIENNVDESRVRELKNVLKYINTGNPFDERISWAALLSYIMDDIQDHSIKVQDAVSDFMINKWDK